jgi:hypothetical protein
MDMSILNPFLTTVMMQPFSVTNEKSQCTQKDVNHYRVSGDSAKCSKWRGRDQVEEEKELRFFVQHAAISPADP